MPNKQEVIESKSDGEEYEDSVVVVTNTAGEPHAVVVKAIVTAIAQLAVLGVVWDHNLQYIMFNSIFNGLLHILFCIVGIELSKLICTLLNHNHLI